MRAIQTIGTAIGITALAGAASAGVVDFNTFSTGTVNGQGGWTVEDEFGFGRADINQTPYDQEVVDVGGGNNALRLSNAVTSGGFSDQVYSHTSPVPAGESGSALWNDRGSDHTMPLSPPNPGTPVGSNFFKASYKFKSATDSGQAGLNISTSISAKQSSFRNTFLDIQDDGVGGLDLRWYDTGTSADPFGASSVSTQLATDLAYDEWHSVEIFIEFVDGLNSDTTGNDIVHILVNGTLVHVGTTWESFYVGSNLAGLDPADQPHRQAVDSIGFFARGTAVTSLDGGGLFFDDVHIDNTAFNIIPMPTPLAMAGLGLMGVAGMRRRRA